MKIGYKLGIILLWIVFCSLASAQQVMNPQFSATKNISFSIKDDRGIAITNAIAIFEPIYQGTSYPFPASHQGSGKYQVDLPTNVAIDGTFRMTITEAEHETYSQNINIHTNNNFTVVILYNDYYEKYSVARDQLIEQFDRLTATIDLAPIFHEPQGTISTAPRSREETFIVPFPLSDSQADKAAFAQMIKQFNTKKDIYYDLIKEIVLQTAIKELGPLDATISAWLDNKYQHALSFQQPGDVMEMMKEFAGFIGAPLNSLGITTVTTFSNIIYDAAMASNEGLYKAGLLAFSYHLYQQQCIDLFIQKSKAAFGTFDPALREAILKAKNDIERERHEQLDKIVNSYRNKQLTGAVAASVSKEVAALVPGALCSIAGISLSAGPQVVLFLITKLAIDLVEGSFYKADLQLRMILLAKLEALILSGYGNKYSPEMTSQLHSHPEVYYGTLMRIYSGYLYHTMRNKLYSSAPNMTTKIIDAIQSTPFTRQIADVSEHKSIDFAGEYYKLYYEFLRGQQFSVARDQLIEQFDWLTATIDLAPFQTPQGTISTAPRSREEPFIIPFPLSASQADKAAFSQMIKPFNTRTDIYYELIKEVVLQTAIKELGPLDATISAWLDNKYQHSFSLPQPGDVMEMMKEVAGLLGASMNTLDATAVTSFSNIIYDAAKASNEGVYKAVLLAFSYHLYQQQCIDLFIQKNKAAFGSFDPALQGAILKAKNDIERERHEQLEKIVKSYHNRQLTGAVAASVTKEVAGLVPGVLCSIAGISLSAGPQVVLFLFTKFATDVIEGSIRSRDLQLRMILLAQLEKYALSGYGHQYSPEICSRLHSHPDVYYGTLMRIYSGYLYHTMRHKLYSHAPNMTSKIIDAIYSTPFTRQIAAVSERKSRELAEEYFKLYYDFLIKQEPPKALASHRMHKITFGLIIDSSGSMRENDPQDIRKTASELIVNQLSNKETNIFLVDFDDASEWLNENNWQNWNKAELINNIRSIDSRGGTDIGGGLNRMRQVLENRIVLSENVGVLLLTDGMGDYQNEAEWFAQNKIRVSTISFVGNDNSGLLQGIAKLAGGDYMKANTPEDIVNTFNEFITRLMGSNTLCYYQNTINPGQHIHYDFYLDPGVKNVYSSCVWYGSKVGLNFTSPDGMVYAPGKANADWITGDRYIAAKIDNPQPGKWRAEFVGLDIPPGGEPFNFKVNADSPIKIDLVEQGIQGGVVRFALDSSQSAGQIKEMTPTISLLTPKNNVMDITNRYKQGRFDFIPSDGKGNYQITINLTGKNKSDHIFQRHFIKTALIGEYTPLNIAPIKQIIGNYVKAGLGRNVGNRSGVMCYVYPPGGSANNKIARGYVTFVTENECNIEIQQLFGPRQFAVGDIVELDIVQWKNDSR